MAGSRSSSTAAAMAPTASIPPTGGTPAGLRPRGRPTTMATPPPPPVSPSAAASVPSAAGGGDDGGGGGGGGPPLASPPSGGIGLTYAAAGVNISAEASAVKSLLRAFGGSGPPPRPTGTRGALAETGSNFSGLLAFGPSTYLALATDGVGTKLLLAAALGHYETVPIDCMAMNVNDLLCIGAEPLAFVDYIAAPAPDDAAWAALGRGLGAACRAARVSLAGGESASLPEMVREVDMAGTALGWLPVGDELDGGRIAPGDAIIGLPASGVHSNGFSLARKCVDASGLGLTDAAPFDVTAPGVTRAGGDAIARIGDGGTDKPVTVGEVLLHPTYIYVDPLVDLFAATKGGKAEPFGVSPTAAAAAARPPPCAYSDLHGVANITGGGLSNLLRLKDGAGYDLTDPLPVLPEFNWLQAVGGVTDREMYRTFNMGMGMALVVDAAVAPTVVEWLNERLPGCKIVGTVNGSGVVTHAVEGVTFDEY
ncbi:hypothetical protein MMPV_002589 [Pyropia vietnamensis]